MEKKCEHCGSENLISIGKVLIADSECGCCDICYYFSQCGDCKMVKIS